MVPTIAQQLASLQKALGEIIIPALPEDAGFAKEQAGLSLATLGWLADVQAHVYRWEVTENAEYRRLVSELAALAADEAPTVRGLLDTPAPPSVEALPSSDALVAQNAALKAEAERLFAEATTGEGDTPARARVLLAEVSRRQSVREQSWFRMTGFTGASPDVGETLAAP